MNEQNAYIDNRKTITYAICLDMVERVVGNTASSNIDEASKIALVYQAVAEAAENNAQ